jgi:hypothetical protein
MTQDKTTYDNPRQETNSRQYKENTRQDKGKTRTRQLPTWIISSSREVSAMVNDAPGLTVDGGGHFLFKQTMMAITDKQMKKPTGR